MTQSINDHPAVSVLKSFFTEMYSWGAKMIERDESIWGPNGRGYIEDKDQWKRDGVIQRGNLEAIFEKYCESGLQAKRLQDKGVSYNANSPDYDLTYELIESVCEKAGKVVVETKQVREPPLLNWKFKYELVYNDHKWKIKDNKKRSSDKDPTWRADML